MINKPRESMIDQNIKTLIYIKLAKDARMLKGIYNLLYSDWANDNELAIFLFDLIRWMFVQ